MITPDWSVKRAMGLAKSVLGGNPQDNTTPPTENLLMRLAFHDCIPYQGGKISGGKGWLLYEHPSRCFSPFHPVQSYQIPPRPFLASLVLHSSKIAFWKYFHCLDCCCHEGASADGCDGCLNWKGMDWERMKSDAESKRCQMMQ